MQVPDALKPLSPTVLEALQAVARQLPAEQAAARKAGLLLTGAELRTRGKVPDRDNAAPIYRDLTASKNQTASKRVSDALAGMRASHPTPAQVAAAKAALSANADRIARFEQAAAKPPCDFARHWEYGAATTMPELATLREGARLLALKAQVQSADGKPVDALKTVALAAALARHAAADGILIGLLVSVAISAILDRAFHTTLARAGARPDVLAAAESAVKALDTALDLGPALASEAVMAHETLQGLRRGKRYDDIPSLEAFPQPARNEFLGANEVQILRRLRAMAERPSRTDADLRALKVWSDGDDQQMMRSAPKDPSLVLAVVFRPNLSSVVDKLLEHRARARLRSATVLVLRHGVPAGLKLPADPFSGAPLRYRADGKRFTLWSIGANRKDDGGREKVGKDSRADLVVSWP